MASWFSADTFKDLTEKVQASVDSVKDAIPEIDGEMLSKLTLTSPELSAERARIDQEEGRKEETKNMLANMLPWETRDKDRAILVDECREAILKLSTVEDTFLEPYRMPKKGKVGAKATEDDEDNESDDEFEKEPSKESLEQLEKLQPLPPLLDQFDLDCHVGLIERVLREDANLVKMQSQLSGAGEREQLFWKNYFVHCACTRYEAGLSVDELWSDQQQEAAAAEEKEQQDEAPEEEDTITFDDQEETSPAFSGDPQTEINEKDSNSSQGVDFEMVNDSGNEDNILDSVDYELDELEAEIARELED